MIFGKTKMELQVGIFVFIALVILVTFVLLIGNIRTWTSGYRINFTFYFVNGIRIGSPVRFAGVDVGEVKGIKFLPAPGGEREKIQITGWLRKDVKIPVDSAVWINTLGLLGEKYIEIMPGQDYNNNLAAGGTLLGVDPIAIHEVTRLAKNIVTDLDESIVKIKNKEGTVGKLLYDDTIYNELEALVSDIRKHPWKLFWKTKENK